MSEEQPTKFIPDNLTVIANHYRALVSDSERNLRDLKAKLHTIEQLIDESEDLHEPIQTE